MVVGDEVGEEETPHLQGYVVFTQRKLFTAVTKWMPRGHFEVKRGTAQQASDYCKKDNKFVEYGVLPKEGCSAGGKAKAEKYRSVIKKAKAGAFEELIEDEPGMFFNHYHTIKRIRQDYMTAPADLKEVCGEWIWGAPGVGKSYMARQENPGYFDKAANKWWDGYQGNGPVLIDDFDKVHSVLGHHLKRWGDRYAFPGEMKGTTVQIRPSKLVVTSNYSIEDVFSHDTTLCHAIQRRFRERHLVQPSKPRIADTVEQVEELSDDWNAPTQPMDDDAPYYVESSDEDSNLENL